MVERWYKGYKCTYKPSELVERISKTIQEFSLSCYIPLLRIEKGAKPKKVYYFFLAIESQKAGEIPSNITKSQLLELPFFRSQAVPGNSIFSYEQIRNMVGRGHKIEDYTNPIPYQVTEPILYDDPFDLSLLSHNLNPDLEEQYQQYQYLLYWLSSVSKGTWESFKKICQALELKEPKRILRRLKLLGHLETYQNGKKWFIAPTALVQIEPEQNKYILCGQQNEKLLSAFKELTTISLTNQHREDAPPCITIEINDSIVIEKVIESIKNKLDITIHLVGKVSKRLAEILPNIEEWKLGLETLQGIVTSIYEWKQYNGQEFVSCILPQETGMYQMLNKKGYTFTIFYDSSTDTWKQGDWYGLRFLSLYYSQEESIASYDFKTSRLAIPWEQRWPELYERALVLASGKLPTYQNHWLVYDNISQHLAQQLTAKLQINLQEKNK